ncbi:MAG: 3-phosphoshikimate 1-carboxyvinyltransferase [Prevotellaceae bacterium]|nr:3-phosphoshikimate 1-carboxyvinyltransferase [Prevotellaceae bacterium]MDO4931826.1 3-phosphoshikimate 1-carboxyvinyltransferase [Prevotellaceae bacterium]
MQYILNAPDILDCEIMLPASKSISNRALVINALAGNGSHPENLSVCDDTDVMVAALRDMPYEIDIKAAGTAMRFTTALLAVGEGEHVITGTERMRHRPITVLVDALRSLGADIEYQGEEGFPPLHIRGRQLEGGRLDIAGNVSSQYISALLMVGPVMTKGLTLHLTGNVISRPYIDLTICTMQEFGADVEWEDASTIVVKPQPYKAVPFFIENDWSASSYWYEMLALLGRGESQVRLPGLMDGSRQGDSAIRYIFTMLGVKTKFDAKLQNKPTTVTLSSQRMALPRFSFDFVNQPDLAQTVVVTAALCGVPFRFTGLQTLRIKETDRIAALKYEMSKLGYVLDDSEEGVLSWDGTVCEPMEHPEIDTYEDHRMAMAFAPAAIRFPGLRINNPEVVSKSYPGFWNDLRKAGWKITEAAADGDKG